MGMWLTAKLIRLYSVEEINLLMFQKVKQLAVEQPHLLVLKLQKQIWVQLENLHHKLQQKVKVRREYLHKNQEPHQHQIQRQLLVKNLLNLLHLLKKQGLNLLPPRQKDKVEIRRFKNNPLIIKFLAQAHLAVKKPLQFSSRNPLKQVLQSNQNREPQLLEQVKLCQQVKNLPLGLPFNSRKAS
jgi:hypothetical protein